MGKKPKRKLSAYNKHMSREMKRGKTFKQAVRSWKGGKTSASPKRRSSTTNRRSNTTTGRGSFSTQKLFKWVRMGALIAPAAVIVFGGGTAKQKGQWIATKYTGVHSDGSFSWEELAKGWTPYIATCLMTYGVPKLVGIIRGM